MEETESGAQKRRNFARYKKKIISKAKNTDDKSGRRRVESGGGVQKDKKQGTR